MFQQFDASGGGIQNSFNEYGYHHLIKDAFIVEGSQAPLYTVTAMNARRQVTEAILASGYTTQTGYDSQTGRVTVLTTDLGGGLGQVQSIAYTYDALGNVKTRHNQSGSKNLNEGFCYDDLNRLTQTHQDGTQCGGTDDITYDSFGNIKARTV